MGGESHQELRVMEMQIAHREIIGEACFKTFLPLASPGCRLGAKGHSAD